MTPCAWLCSVTAMRTSVLMLLSLSHLPVLPSPVTPCVVILGMGVGGEEGEGVDKLGRKADSQGTGVFEQGQHAGGVTDRQGSCTVRWVETVLSMGLG